MRTRTVLLTAALCAAASGALAAQDWGPSEPRRGDGVHIRIARDYYLASDSTASFPVVVIGGSATIDGRLEDDLVVIGGSVRVGPKAYVRGDIVSVGGTVDLAPGAEVSGEVNDVRMVWPGIRFALHDWFSGLDRGSWAIFTLASTVVRFALVLLVASLLSLVAPRWIRRISDRVDGAPIAAGLIGLGTQILLGPALAAVVVGLVVTIVGIPLLVLMPFVMVLFVVAWAAGFAAVAAHVGHALRDRQGLAADGLVVLDTLWGVLALSVVTFVGNLMAFGPPFMRPASAAFSVAGFAIEYLAWTLGLGAALLAAAQGRRRSVPPPIPSTAAA